LGVEFGLIAEGMHTPHKGGKHEHSQADRFGDQECHLVGELQGDGFGDELTEHDE
jgi:hypothetical protein